MVAPNRPSVSYGWAIAFNVFLGPGMGQLLVGRSLRGVFLLALNPIALSTAIWLWVDRGEGSVWWTVLAVCMAWVPHVLALVDLVWQRRRLQAVRPNQLLIVWLVYACALVGAALVIRVRLFEPIRAAGLEALPMLRGGETVLVDVRARSPERGDLVVYLDGANERLLRVVGVPGDQVSVRSGRVLLNDFPIGRCKVGRMDVKISDSLVTAEVWAERINGIPFATLAPNGLMPADEGPWLVPKNAVLLFADYRTSDAVLVNAATAKLLGRVTYVLTGGARHPVPSDLVSSWQTCLDTMR